MDRIQFFFLTSLHFEQLIDRFAFFFRNKCVRDWIEHIENVDGGLNDFSQAYKYYGLNFQSDSSVIAREWAPGAVQVYLTGDFSKCCGQTVLSSFYVVKVLTEKILIQIIGNGKRIQWRN